MKNSWIFGLLWLTQILSAQKTMQGQVIDYDTTIPIAFAMVSYQNQTVYTNWEGRFSLVIDEETKPIQVSYKGYHDKNHYLSVGAPFILIKMVSDQSQKSAEIYTDNETNAILKKVIENRSKNQPEKVLQTYEYKNYETLLVTANPDSISTKIDTIYKPRWFGKPKMVLDSSNYKFKKLVEKQHLYQTEKVNLIQFNNYGTKETVLASRMAGFKKPLYEYLGLNLISYSLYDRYLDILEVTVQNPISSYGRKMFVFKMVDTLTIQGRTVYRIYFQPKKINSNKLRGLLYIDAENFAIAKAFFRVYGMVNINATYTFNWLPKHNIWFPEKRKLMVVKGDNSEDLKLFGGTIMFNSSIEGLEQNASDRMYLKLESKPFDVKINQNVVTRQPAIRIDVPESSMSKPDGYWRIMQRDTLDRRKMPTYINIDSLAAAEKIEHKIFLGRKIFNGYLPLGKFDLDLRSILKYNNYEGFRLGFGGTTNTRFSEKYKIGAYVAYGLKDDAFKYHIAPSLLLDAETNSWASLSYTDDVAEIGQIQFATESRRFRIYDPRPINISTFYNHKTASAYWESKYIPKTDLYAGISRSAIAPRFEYQYQQGDRLLSEYTLTTLQMAVQWNPFSSYMQTSTGRLEINKRYPKFTLQLTQAFNQLLGADFQFSKIDFRINHEIKYLSGQETGFIIQSGLVFGEAPLTHLYSIAPNNLNRDALLKRITIAGKNSFETMFFNEFFSSRYISFQARHTFNKVKIAYRIKPEISVVTRMAFGTMENKERHLGFTYKTLEEGYFESGVEVNQLFKGFGITFFTRYGPYGLAKFEDNLSLKVSYNLDLGF